MDYLTTINAAINLVKRLIEINKTVKHAEFANLLADLSLQIAESNSKIGGLISENNRLKEKIRKLESKSGEKCPKCGNYSFELKDSKDDPNFPEALILRIYECANCKFSENRQISKLG